MAIKALRGIVPEWYTPLSEREDPAPTKFKIQPLTMPQFEEVTTVVGDQMGLAMKDYEKVLHMGLIDWENFPDPDTGAAVEFLPLNFKRIPFNTRSELASRIYLLSQMDSATVKNSESQ